MKSYEGFTCSGCCYGLRRCARNKCYGVKLCEDSAKTYERFSAFSYQLFIVIIDTFRFGKIRKCISVAGYALSHGSAQARRLKLAPGISCRYVIMFFCALNPCGLSWSVAKGSDAEMGMAIMPPTLLNLTKSLRRLCETYEGFTCFGSRHGLRCCCCAPKKHVLEWGFFKTLQRLVNHFIYLNLWLS